MIWQNYFWLFTHWIKDWILYGSNIMEGLTKITIWCVRKDSATQQFAFFNVNLEIAKSERGEGNKAGASAVGDLLCVSSQLQGTPEALWRPRPSPYYYTFTQSPASHTQVNTSFHLTMSSSSFQWHLLEFFNNFQNTVDENVAGTTQEPWE